MSHGDRVHEIAGWVSKWSASATNAPFADRGERASGRIYSTMFHPEVVHTPDGGKLLRNFTHKIAGLQRRLDDGARSRTKPSRASVRRSATAR